MNNSLLSLLFGLLLSNFQSGNTVRRNGLEVSWEHLSARTHFSVKAPTQGWIAIGFNKKSDLKGTFLIMCRIVDSVVEVEPHYILGPGDYKPVADLNQRVAVRDISGVQDEKTSKIQFSIPSEVSGNYSCSFLAGDTYHMLLAYSLSPEFQHHSIMRTSVLVVL